MIIENIEVTQAELNTAVAVVKDISELILPNRDNFDEDYYARSLIINNNTSDIINYTVLTEAEYEKYVETSGSITSLLPVYQEQSDSISNLQGRLNKLVVRGNGAHTSEAIFSIVKTG